MGKRIGIAEAPDATLGESGVEQLIPLLEVGTLRERTPKKTSIRAMAAFFGGDIVISSPQVQRFEIPAGTTVALNMGSGTTPGNGTVSSKLNMVKKDTNPIAGDENYYTVSNNNIVFSVAGYYRIKGAFYAQTIAQFYPLEEGATELEGPAFIKLITVSGPLVGETFTGETQTAIANSGIYNVIYCQFDEYIEITTAGDFLQFNAQVFNQGAISTFGTNRWTFSNSFSGTTTSVTVENIR